MLELDILFFSGDTIEGSGVRGDCFGLLAEPRCLVAGVGFEPCEKHAQTRKRPPCRTEPVAENGLERHSEDVEVIVGVIDPVVSVHHVELGERIVAAPCVERALTKE